ncbi:hypothetical protein MMC07_002804 [Pseudocyphellaria aurata]|nr:hypothetical protein [Pseudocyphellaria aurata]
MAQKAAKQLAARNAAILYRMHLISLGINVSFVLLRYTLLQASSSRATYLLYFVLASPAFAIQFWLEKIGRPATAQNGDLQKPGADLEAQGLMEYLWDVLYWSWGCIVAATVFGNKAWWLWAVIPLYSLWLAYTTFGGIKQSMGGMMGQGSDLSNTGNTSNRQKKFEKRGGQKVQYR